MPLNKCPWINDIHDEVKNFKEIACGHYHRLFLYVRTFLNLSHFWVDGNDHSKGTANANLSVNLNAAVVLLYN